MKKFIAIATAVVCACGLSLGCQKPATDAPATPTDAVETATDAATEAVEDAADAATEAVAE